MNKRLTFSLTIIFLITISGCTAANAPGGLAYPQEAPRQRTISVTGNAEVLVIPDEVILTLGVETWNNNLETAKTYNDQIVKKVLETTPEFGVDPKHVQTDYIQIEPRYEDYAQRQFLGYFVRKTIVIHLKDVSKFEELLSQVLQDGVNYIHGVDFRTSELRKHRDQARSLALKAAQEKANAMAKELGQQAGQPLSIREEYNQWWYPYSSWWGYGATGGMSQNVIQNASGAPPQSEGGLALGQISVTASVAVEFELK